MITWFLLLLHWDLVSEGKFSFTQISLSIFPCTQTVRGPFLVDTDQDFLIVLDKTVYASSGNKPFLLNNVTVCQTYEQPY